jgi:hypothetical protein
MSFAANVPRIVPGLGYLAEPSATNLLTYSTGYTSWVGSNTVVTNNAGTAPDGTNTADKIVVNAGSNSNWSAARPATTSVISGSTYTTSVYVKPSGYTRLQLAAAVFNGGAWGDVLFDLSTNTVVQGGSGVTFVFTNCANGWVRIAGTWVATANGEPSLYIKFVPSSVTTVNTTYTADGASGGLIWNIQVEAGLTATSPIPTTTAAVTRPADVGYFTGSFPGPAGTLAATWIDNKAIGLAGIASINNGSYVNKVDIRASSLSANSYLTVGGVSMFGTPYGSAGTLGTLHSAAISWDASKVMASSNGSALVSSTPTAVLSNLTRLNLGDIDGGGVAALTGYLSKVALWTSAANDSETQYRAAGNF